jgi:hypothetical protein
VDPAPFKAGSAHRRRLRELWRSAGWPFQDPLEAELLAAGLLVRERDAQGRDTVRVTDAGVRLLADTLQKNRAARSAHEALVARVVCEMQRAGRVVWRGLTLRARVGGEPALPVALPDVPGPSALQAGEPAAGWLGVPASGAAQGATAGEWVLAMPDVYSIRHTTVEAYVAPVAHEIKVQRADLLADLRRPAKGEAYRWLSGECWYVIREGIAEPQEIPEVYGVLVAPERGPLVVARHAPQRPTRLPFGVWMALARAAPEPADDDAQQLLGGMPPDSAAADPGLPGTAAGLAGG